MLEVGTCGLGASAANNEGAFAVGEESGPHVSAKEPILENLVVLPSNWIGVLGSESDVS